MNWLHIARTQRNLSQAELARRTNIGQPRLSRIEKGLVLPTPEQSLALAKELGVDGFPCSADLIEEKKLAGLGRPFELESYNQERWRIALKTWAFRIQRLPINPRLLALMRQFFRVDSALEALAWLLLAAAGARFFLGNPYRWGYRGHTITDSQGQCLGERHLPGLYYQDQQNELWIWPQLNLRPQEINHRPDGLVLYNSRWLRLEMDGDGHDPAKDAFRDKQLNMPTIRLTEKEIKTAPNLLELILKRASECR